MNKLSEPVFNHKEWGNEVIWSITDHYMSKTIEIAPYKVTDLYVYEHKEKSIIVIQNKLILAYGKCCLESNLEYTELPEGWSRYIASGEMHRYGATSELTRIIEISSPQLDEAIIIDPERMI